MFIRRVNKKEDSLRIRERFGYPSITRPEGFLIWIHGASVGEAYSIIPLVETILNLYPKIRVLITTGTVNSAKVVVENMPAKAMHQYIPIDSFFAAKRFVKHWQPEIVIFTESDLWPNLIDLASRNSHMLLINARISPVSYRRWKLLGNFAKILLNKFGLIIAQSDQDASYYQGLGAACVKTMSNLKYACRNFNIDRQEYDLFKQCAGAKKILVVASTHDGDERIICDLHAELKKQYDLLTIIVPRHPKRANRIIDIFISKGLNFAIRTNLDKVNKGTDIYLANTIGELGVFYSLADVIFVGGSFCHGGHNPIEAAYFQKIVIFGPDMSNFSEISKEFISKKGAIQIHTYDDLKEAISNVFNFTQKERDRYVNNAKKIIRAHSKVISKYIAEISKYIPKYAKIS